MGITGGFGTTIDLARGTSRQWVMGRDGVKRWADSGQPLTQELLNSMMRNPGETRVTAAPALPKCPQCGERYCGNGDQPCIECEAPNSACKDFFGFQPGQTLLGFREEYAKLTDKDKTEIKDGLIANGYTIKE